MSIAGISKVLNEFGVGRAGGLGGIESGKEIAGGELGRTEKPSSFGDALKDAINKVNDLDASADRMVAEATSGTKQYAPHELIMSLEKADVAFDLMNKVRQQVIRAYEEIMRTPV